MSYLKYIFATIALYFVHGDCYAPITALRSETDFSVELVEKPSKKPTANILKVDLPDTIGSIVFDPMLLNGLQFQAEYLQKKSFASKTAAGLLFSDLSRTVSSLAKIGPLLNESILRRKFDFFQIQTTQKYNRVRLTGYYTPVVEASPEKTPEFRHAFCRNPKAKGEKADTPLELAWVRDEKTLKNAQLQGSCIVEFPDGQHRHLGFGGSTKRFGRKPYVYFQDMGEERVFGANNLPLTPGYSIAVDPRYIPLGSCLLAELPQLDVTGKLLGYTYRIVLAQDRGGAIKTSNRIDLYCGKGKEALEEAIKINGQGRFWLMLPK